MKEITDAVTRAKIVETAGKMKTASKIMEMVEIPDLSLERIEIKAITEEEIKDNHHYYIHCKNIAVM